MECSYDTATNTSSSPIDLCQIPTLHPVATTSTSKSDFTFITNQQKEVLILPHIQIPDDQSDNEQICQMTPIQMHFLEDPYEDTCLQQHGYSLSHKICDSMQGEILMAHDSNRCNVVIKKVYKQLYFEQISLRNMGKKRLIEEDIHKEANILRYLTVDNKPTNDCIIKFIECFESDNCVYLVTEHVGTITFADFNRKAHLLIAQKKLKTKKWKQIVKYLMWQLSVIIFWLHNDIHCCHLDLCLQNILVVNGDFVEDNEGNIGFNSNISIKLIDFGLSEMFLEIFACSKHGEREKHYLSAPKVFAEEVYDARKADVWSLGVILYELATGLELYRAQDVIGVKKVIQPNTLDNLMELIALNEKTKHVNHAMVKLMVDLLNIEEKKRINVDDILNNKWMSLYYQRYKTQIEKKSNYQAVRNKKLAKKMIGFPFYINIYNGCFNL